MCGWHFESRREDADRHEDLTVDDSRENHALEIDCFGCYGFGDG